MSITCKERLGLLEKKLANPTTSEPHPPPTLKIEFLAARYSLYSLNICTNNKARVGIKYTAYVDKNEGSEFHLNSKYSTIQVTMRVLDQKS
ncbi:hypothetical protein O9G_002151 [Rozella allomycis CSF55]|uniref:Uncharacterized protein n=1 Tax=Rozella allomycis (strain CSF55) TaxID=988480 RepID=A0A075AQ84_ROZAC|nr:hypothetical protein O9G_002151 [Rozella allomycis CSF55]|eukprot:EPZ32310.1 hypothetical protein O9G_002151 [Rozella allomycis CSF55]